MKDEQGRRRLFSLLAGLRRRMHGFYLRTGALLTAGLAVAMLALLAFSNLSEVVLEGETTAMETRWMLWIDDRSTAWLDRVAVQVTALGSGVVVLTIAATVAGMLWLLRLRRYAVLLGGAVAGAALLNRILKIVFDRPRPQVFDWRVEYANMPSYPSGHATSVTVLFLVLGYVVHRLGSGRRGVSAVATAVACLVPLAVGLSRVYLGVHYPTDVLASYAIGLIWTVFAIFVVEERGRRSESNESNYGEDSPNTTVGESDSPCIGATP